MAVPRRCPEHPFGYGRERYIYALIVSIVLFSVGGLFALYEAWGKIQHPRAIEGDSWWVPLAVLVGAIIAESFSFRTAAPSSAWSSPSSVWGSRSSPVTASGTPWERR
ncbi:divalent metal cation (Fe/Co/Zn/Cd) transporter [Arthrobacter sp. V4I6]|nr:divalent metal cation (Fe/Co/Zn/Cd) transporter [Arthrobacter sp. V1I7]MDQ0856132.1 divalent metal cation (Fe/Co/Zn/Cd) transporter [Arthrobacter sp. V4I6]